MNHNYFKMQQLLGNIILQKNSIIEKSMIGERYPHHLIECKYTLLSQRISRYLHT